MASTIPPKRAMDYAKEFVQSLPVDRDSVRLRILDDAAKLIWTAAPWRWSVGVLTPTALTNNADEVTITGGVPAGFLKLLWAGLATADSDQIQDLVVVAALPDAGLFKGQPKRITATPVATDTFRLWPIPSGYGASLPSLLTVYKKAHTEITATNESTAGALVQDDDWYFVYDAAVLYYVYLYAEDPRAPGQLQTVMALLEVMRATENPVLGIFGEPVR